MKVVWRPKTFRKNSGLTGRQARVFSAIYLSLKCLWRDFSQQKVMLAYVFSPTGC